MQNAQKLIDNYRCHHVFPALAIDLCSVHPEEVSVRELTDIIAKDVALTLEVVALSNAPYYGASVHSLNEAILVMGIQRTINVAIGFVLLRVLDKKSSHINLVQFRSRSFLSAIACQAIGRTVGCNKTERLFLAGLLQDIGMMVFDDVVGYQYKKCLEHQQNHELLSMNEQELHGMDHATLGAMMMDNMGLPNDLVVGVSNSHDLLTEGDLFSLCVALSGHISDVFLAPDRLQAHAHAHATIYARAYLGIDKTDFNGIVDAVSSEADQTKSYFKVSVDTRNIKDLLSAQISGD